MDSLRVADAQALLMPANYSKFGPDTLNIYWIWFILDIIVGQGIFLLADGKFEWQVRIWWWAIAAVIQIFDESIENTWVQWAGLALLCTAVPFYVIYFLTFGWWSYPVVGVIHALRPPFWIYLASTIAIRWYLDAEFYTDPDIYEA